MLKTSRIRILALLFVCVLTLLSPIPAFASESSKNVSSVYYTNAETSYKAVITDAANLIEEPQEKELSEWMADITAYSNVALITTSANSSGSAKRFAELCNNQLFGDGPGVVFLIDMDNRMLYIDSTGSARKTITSAYANTITDNVYTKAHDGNYYECAQKAFEQIGDLFQGRRIAQPMRYISSLLLALVLAAMINFFLVHRTSRKHQATSNELVEGVFSKCEVNNPAALFQNQTRTYSPRSSSSSSGSSGGGGGGGGHSGGGHSF